MRSTGPSGWLPRVAVAASLSLHGLMLLGLAVLPAPREKPRDRLVIETCVLSIASPTASPAPSVPKAPPAPPQEEPFEAKLLAPGARAAPPVVALPRAVQGPATAARGSSAFAPAAAGPGSAGTTRPALFGPVAAGQRVVYVIDRSVSMGWGNKFAHARHEVLAAIRQLPPSACFQVVAYNRHATPLQSNGSTDMLPNSSEALRQVEAALAEMTPSGATDHALALRCALAFRPDIIYFVTDADDLKVQDLQAIARWNRGQAVVHAIELCGRREPRADSSLRLLAQSNRGTYRCVSPPQ